MTFYAHNSNGELKFEDPEKLKNGLSRLSNGRVQVIVMAAPSRLSERLRRYYWGLCRLIKDFLRDSGDFHASVEQVHERNKRKYLTETDMDYRTGELIEEVRSHTDLTSSEMLELCHDLQIEWAQRGLYLPDPNEGQIRDVTDEANSNSGGPGSQT